MKYVDYYEALGIPRTASEKEIKQAYRKLARQHHPDLHQGAAKKNAEEKFKTINEAYEVLSDPEKRAKYDRLGANWQSGQEFDPRDMGGFAFNPQDFNQASFDFGGFGFSDFFNSIFGRDFARHQAAGPHVRPSTCGEDIDAEISLTVEELLKGTEKELRLNMPNVCGACGGRRFTGRGVCQVCGGLGTTEEARTVKVKIPSGLHPGAAIRLKGLGGKGLGDSPSGNLYLHTRLAPHATWRLADQADLEGDLTIFPEQAVLGDKVSVPTPHGTVQLKIQPGIHAGQKLRLKGKGLHRKDGNLGDLYLIINIDIPAACSPEEIELYRKIQALRK